MVHERDQLTGAFRDTAAMLSVFRDALIEEGFSEEGAENLTELLFVAAVSDD